MYVYIDGESHFIRSEQCVREIFGTEANIDTIAEQSDEKNAEFIKGHEGSTTVSAGMSMFKKMVMLVDRRCKFFWDNNTFPTCSDKLKRYSKDPPIAPINKIYFSSASGDDDLLHTLRTYLRDNGFEPRIVKEPNQLAKRRDSMLGNEGIIEKPKGVDISLTVRLLEDAQRDVFSECLLFTSDVDYIPVIEAVQRMGKRVYVFGYRNGIGKNSAMEFIPDAFADLTACMAERKKWLDYDLKAGMEETLQKFQEAAKKISIPKI